jgi:hypothetical protein
MDNALLLAGAVAVIAIVIAVARLRSQGRARTRIAQTSSQYFGPAEIEAYVREHATQLGRETFPDNPDVKWIVHGFAHMRELILAEVEPEPAEIGYPRFKFGFVGGRAVSPKHVATYCLESGAYTLLCTAQGAPRDLPRRLE